MNRYFVLKNLSEIKIRTGSGRTLFFDKLIYIDGKSYWFYNFDQWWWEPNEELDQHPNSIHPKYLEIPEEEADEYISVLRAKNFLTKEGR